MSRYADYLNGAAALVLVVLLVVQCQYLPLDHAIADWSSGGHVSLRRSDFATFYRVEFTVLVLFWIVLYLVKFSLLMLYRALFAIQTRFRISWWGVFAFTAVAFLIDILSSLWLCGQPAGLFDICKVSTHRSCLKNDSRWC